MNDFVESGSTLPLKVEGIPVGEARVVNVTKDGVYVSWEGGTAEVPLATFDYEDLT